MSNLYEDEKILNLFKKNENKLQDLLKKVNPETLKNEKQLKQTLKLVAMFGKIAITEQQLDRLVVDLKSHDFDPKDPNSLKKFIKTMKAKK